MITLKNAQLMVSQKFLDKLELPPKASRTRTKLMLKIQTKIDELYRDEIELIERYGKKDEEGKLVENDGSYQLIEKTATDYHKEKRELLEDSIHIDVNELQDKFPFLVETLENSPQTFSGQEADTLNLLLESLEHESEED